MRFLTGELLRSPPSLTPPIKPSHYKGKAAAHAAQESLELTKLGRATQTALPTALDEQWLLLDRSPHLARLSRLVSRRQIECAGATIGPSRAATSRSSTRTAAFPLEGDRSLASATVQEAAVLSSRSSRFALSLCSVFVVQSSLKPL